MRNPWQGGVLAISIDLETGRTSQRSITHRRDTVARLLDALARHHLPATWAIANPAPAAESEVRAIGPHHELALRGDAAWGASRHGHVRLALELSRRLSSAREAGLEIAAVALEQPMAGLPAEALVEHGIRAVWSLSRDEPSRPPAMLRTGLWNLPVSHRAPLAKGWLGSVGGGIRPAIRKAVAQGELIHLAIDAGALEGVAAVTAVEAVLKTVGKSRDKGEIGVSTLSRLAADLSQARQSTPLRSILRAA